MLAHHSPQKIYITKKQNHNPQIIRHKIRYSKNQRLTKSYTKCYGGAFFKNMIIVRHQKTSKLKERKLKIWQKKSCSACLLGNTSHITGLALPLKKYMKMCSSGKRSNLKPNQTNTWAPLEGEGKQSFPIKFCNEDIKPGKEDISNLTRSSKDEK